MRCAAEAPPGGDLGDGQVREAAVGQVVTATAQPLLVHPGREAESFAREQPVQLPDRDVAGPGSSRRSQPAVAQIRERMPFQICGHLLAVTGQLVLPAGRRPRPGIERCLCWIRVPWLGMAGIMR